ncbi:T9SS type A sorting domain-containing protein, partial [Prolixibacteraceae bacterium Z1-6]|nr:T9SS type A sorting domain-containing protein [Prolixibacteraceae bacterium Z1-6]
VVAIGSAQYWIRSTNPDDGDALDCYSKAMVTLTVWDNPDLEVDDAASCEEGTSGVAHFDLSAASILLNADDGTISYHKTATEADNGTSPIDPAVTVAIGDSIFWIRSTNKYDGDLDCHTVEMVTMTVYEAPSCNITKVKDATDYENTDGLLTIDITTTSVDIVDRNYEWYVDGVKVLDALPDDEDLTTPGIQVTVSGLADPPGLEYCLRILEDHGGGIVCEHTCCEFVLWSPSAPSCRTVGRDAICFGDNNGEADIYVKGVGTFTIELDTFDTSTDPPTLTLVWGPVTVPKTGIGDAETKVTATGLYAGEYQAYFVDNGSPLTVNYSTCRVSIGQPDEVKCTISDIVSATCGESNGGATVSIEGGTPPYSISLDGINYVPVTGATHTFTTLPPGPFDIFILDMYNCPGDCNDEIPNIPCEKIFPTQTTCWDIRNDWAVPLPEVCLTLDGDGAVTNAVPGVFFYYTIITPPAADFRIDIKQWDGDGMLNGGLFDVVQGKDIKIFDEACSKLNTEEGVDATGTQAWIEVTGADVNQTYVLGVKYEVKSILGTTWASGPTDVANFYFKAYLSYGSVVEEEDLNSYGKIGAIPCAEKAAEIKDPILQATDLKVYPNPFSEKVTFEFVSGKDAYGVLEIYNITGQRVARLLDRYVERGVLNTIEYVPESKVTGMYLYKLDLDGRVQIGRVIYKE